MNHKQLIIIYLICFYMSGFAQTTKTFKIHTVAFYNLENMFDTINDPLKYDESSPIMELTDNRSAVYSKKIENMARVIAEIGTETSKNTPAILGIAEIENRAVLEDLINTPKLRTKNYGIVHFDSPDMRGIDVALLYQKKIFRPTHQKTYTLKLYDNTTGKRIYTRDQLLVSGVLEGERLHIIVNHWPSRRGGEAKSQPKRIAAAKLNKHIIDSLQAINVNAKIISMGDLNDNPTNPSIRKILKAKQHKKKVGFKNIYNPFIRLFKNGLGTNAYRDNWSLFDQMLFTKSLIDDRYTALALYKVGIFNKNFLTTKHGKFRGYPKRSFANGIFTNGYSDHFPVYCFLLKKQ